MTMSKPQVDITQSPAEGTTEASPRETSSSVSSSRSLSISTTLPAKHPEMTEISSPTDSVNSTNLSEISIGSGGAARVGNSTCLGGALNSIQAAVMESRNTGNAPRLSSEYSSHGSGVSRSIDHTIGVAKVGAATCWSKLTTLAWDMSLSDGGKTQRFGETKSNAGVTTPAINNVERLRRMAAESVKVPELPSSEVDDDGLAVEVIETIDSL